jgi:hypothetical protein
MNKKQLLLIGLVFSMVSLSAQKVKNEIKVSAALQIPVGEFGRTYKTGLGINVTDYILITDKDAFLFSAGFNQWKTGAVSSRTYTGNIKDITIGYRYKNLKGIYFEIKPGLALYGDVFGSGNRFLIEAGGGYQLPVGSKGAIDFSLNIKNTTYNRGVFYNWIGIGAGYLFKF